MDDRTSNDNDAARAYARMPEPDAYGQAAMFLTESLIHGLIARKVITVADAVEIVGAAAEVKEEVGEELGESPVTLQRSLVLLDSISRSLANDLDT